MSEEENKKKEETIRIEIDRTAEIERLQTENQDLNTKLTIIAEKELNAKARKYNVDLTGLSPEQQVQAVRDAERANQTTALLTESQITGQLPKTSSGESSDWKEKEYDSEEDALRAIRTEAQKGNREAQQILMQKMKETLGKNQTIEMEGQISPWEFQGLGKPAKYIPRKDRKNPVFVPVVEKRGERD